CEEVCEIPTGSFDFAQDDRCEEVCEIPTGSFDFAQDDRCFPTGLLCRRIFSDDNCFKFFW
ncbi:hypothetical protein KKE47_06000, partial [Patescibacteria group bacterium]|nr:hypothetical protein [Patescibacteria group bacterium]MBU4265589.1 hypothetical protein [Patescibacteria group bacterium]MCG2702111.1 hypothetical protein [Candidatus Parcubacteria bacterium]